MMRPVGNHVHAAILRAIAAEADVDSDDREKPIMVIGEIRTTDWASATFVGARHEIDVRLDGEPGAIAAAVDRLTSRLPERDIPISGHIVAEIAVTPVNTSKQKVNIGVCRLIVNVLTITD
jgi:hypothetical protein